MRMYKGESMIEKKIKSESDYGQLEEAYKELLYITANSMINSEVIVHYDRL